MTQTSTPTAAITLAHLSDAEEATGQTGPAAFLRLIELAVGELYGIECGMVNQAPAALAGQNEAWRIQNTANVEIIRAALAAGTPVDSITAITHAERW